MASDGDEALCYNHERAGARDLALRQNVRSKVWVEQMKVAGNGVETNAAGGGADPTFSRAGLKLFLSPPEIGAC